MLSPEPYLIFTRKLKELGVRHMVSGSIAAICYGEPRMPMTRTSSCTCAVRMLEG